eukprot:Skav223781  [mRNA]  locus=scaffold575:12207:17571:+ [translate_table: standard]
MVLIHALIGFCTHVVGRSLPLVAIGCAFANLSLAHAGSSIFQPSHVSALHADFAMSSMQYHAAAWPHRGSRIGEAANPGPAFARFAVINPTSLHNKHDIFDHLLEAKNVHTLCCSETSATSVVQQSFSTFLRKKRMHSHWLAPVPPHQWKLDPTTSLRGKAAGVSLHTKSPSRRPWFPADNDWTQQVRLVHVVMQLGPLWIQVMVVYGFSNGQAQARSQTNELVQRALDRTALLPLPLLLVGDFNMDVHALDVFPQLAQQGFVSLQQIFEQQYGYAMPFTCKSATTPDTALVHPIIASRLANIQVDHLAPFDAHHPVYFDVAIPESFVLTPKIRYPDTWLQYGITATDLAQAVQPSDEQEPPHDLPSWGHRLEQVVHRAMQVEANKSPHLELPPGLPRRCRGRCQPVRRVNCPTVPLSKASRHGSYQPEHEPVTFRTRKLFKQLRRIESLQHRLKRSSGVSSSTGGVRHDIQREWQTITKQRILGQAFSAWTQQIPELGPLPQQVPSREWLFDLQQHVRFVLDQQLAIEAKYRQDLMRMRHRMDVTDGSSRAAFARIRGPGLPAFRNVVTKLDHEAIPVEEAPGTFRLYVAHAQQFVSHSPLFVDGVPVHLRSSDEFSLQVVSLPALPLHLGDTCQVTQSVYHMQESDVATQLNQYWSQFWLRDPPVEQDIPDPTDDPTYQVLWRWTQALCTFLGLEVDWQKTWLWSSDGSGISSLQDLFTEVTGLPAPQVRNFAVDLGCQVAYKSRAIFGKQQVRFDKAKLRLSRLQRQQWSLDVKLHMVRSSIYPAAFFGAELLVVPSAVLTNFRSMVVNAILGESNRSVGSAIFMHLLPKLHDPFLHVILQAVTQSRRFLWTLDAEGRKQFLHLVSRFSCTSRVDGPASALREYLARVGFNCDANGNIQGHDYLAVNLVTSDLEDVLHAVCDEWQKHLLVTHTDRKHIAHWLPMDRPGTLKVLAQFPTHHRLLLLRELAGGFQTREQQATWDEQVDTMCPWCRQQVDSREHRFAECSVFASIRAQYGTLVDDIMEHHSHLCRLPVMRETPEAWLRGSLLAAMPVPTLSDAVHSRLCQLSHGIPCFYTDGSCFFPEHPTVRYASYAVVADLATDDDMRLSQVQLFQQTGQMPQTLVSIAVGRLAGRQTINRAELAAVHWILERFQRARVHTDSAYTQGWVEKLQQDPAAADFPTLRNVDLLLQVRQVLGADHYVQKIKAHQRVQDMPVSLAAYHALGNQLANGAAIEANRSLLPEAAAVLQRFAEGFQEAQIQVTHLYRYLLDLNLARAKLPRQDATAHTLELPDAPLLEQIQVWQAQGSWTHPDTLHDQELTHSAWGPRALGLSWIELAISLAIYHGCWLPVPRQYPDGQWYLVQPRTHHEAVGLKTTLREQAAMATQLLTHYLTLVVEQVVPNYDKIKVRSVLLFGLPERQHGMSLRPSFPEQGRMVTCFRDYVLRFGHDLNHVPDLGWEDALTMWPEDMALYQVPHAELKQQATMAQRRVRKARLP